MGKKLQGIVFDKDGTLFRFADVWGQWCQRVVQELSPYDQLLQAKLAESVGYDLNNGTFAAGSPVVNGSADEISALWVALLDNTTHEQVQQTGLRAMDKLPLPPAADLDHLFSTLSSCGLKLGLATNDYESVAYTHLSELQIKHYFDFICGFDSGYGSKPAPGMINAFCTQTGCDASAVAMVGDSTHDLRAGRAAGAKILIGVLTGPATQADLSADADLVLPDISAIPDALKRAGLL